MSNNPTISYTPILGAPSELAIQQLVTDDHGARFLKLTFSQLLTAIEDGKLNRPANLPLLLKQFQETADTTQILIPLDVYFMTPNNSDKRVA